MVRGADWLQRATRRLTAAGCEDAAFDARCLLEDIGGLPRGYGAAAYTVPADKETALEEALARREMGEPLQYILGNWAFLTLTLAVGPGVLIPRQDTECLCEQAAVRLAGVKAPHVLDLCAGSGCVGLGLASLVPGTAVTAVEWSEQAFSYLQQNVARYPQYAVTAVQADVLTAAADFADGWDAILSNPPYIPTADLPGLMREVQHEPAMALDGQADGLAFYRVIAHQWSGKLRPGGLLAVEIGIGQGPDVAALFAAAGLNDITILPDWAGVERVVLGKK